LGDLICCAISSLDGYIEDQHGKFDWAEPDEEVHRFVNDLEREVGTYLYGRRMNETMAGWETDPSFAAHSPFMLDFAAIWQAADKLVFSTTLEAVFTSRTRLLRESDPGMVRRLKATAGRDLLIGGPGLAAQAFQAGLVDQCHLFLVPILMGGGKRSLPSDVRLRLDLHDQHRFRSGVVFLRYRTKP